MKNLILGAAMLIILVIAFSFSGSNSSNVMVIKPALPKSTLVTHNSDDIIKYAKLGYQVQSQSQGSSGRTLIIMVKY